MASHGECIRALRESTDMLSGTIRANDRLLSEVTMQRKADKRRLEAVLASISASSKTIRKKIRRLKREIRCLGAAPIPTEIANTRTLRAAIALFASIYTALSCGPSKIFACDDSLDGAWVIRPFLRGFELRLPIQQEFADMVKARMGEVAVGEFLSQLEHIAPSDVVCPPSASTKITYATEDGVVTADVVLPAQKFTYYRITKQ
jgi:hypothetical protein